MWKRSLSPTGNISIWGERLGTIWGRHLSQCFLLALHFSAWFIQGASVAELSATEGLTGGPPAAAAETKDGRQAPLWSKRALLWKVTWRDQPGWLTAGPRIILKWFSVSSWTHSTLNVGLVGTVLKIYFHLGFSLKVGWLLLHHNKNKKKSYRNQAVVGLLMTNFSITWLKSNMGQNHFLPPGLIETKVTNTIMWDEHPPQAKECHWFIIFNIVITNEISQTKKAAYLLF